MPYGTVFMNVCIITVAVVTVLKEFGPHGIIFLMTRVY